jgi:hypothetical protein
MPVQFYLTAVNSVSIHIILVTILRGSVCLPKLKVYFTFFTLRFPNILLGIHAQPIRSIIFWPTGLHVKNLSIPIAQKPSTDSCAMLKVIVIISIDTRRREVAKRP